MTSQSKQPVSQPESKLPTSQTLNEDSITLYAERQHWTLLKL